MKDLFLSSQQKFINSIKLPKIDSEDERMVIDK